MNSEKQETGDIVDIGTAMRQAAEDAARPREEQSDQAPAPAPAAEPGLPSPHQNHSKNWIEKTQLDWQQFKLGHDRLTSELSGLDAAFDIAQKQRQAEFDAETKRLTDEHDLKREELLARINDMLDGLTDTEVAIKSYNDRMTERNKAVTGEQQQRQTDEQQEQ